NRHLIDDYYTRGGLPRIETPAPPPFGQGMQIHYGPFFIAPGQETELFKKHDLQLPADVEAYRIEVLMNWQSHHFILWKFDDNALISPALFPDGTRDIYTYPNVLSAKTVFGWQYSDDITLPSGAAYFWNKNTVLDLDYHIKNYHADSILAAEVFINVYYSPKGTFRQEMIAAGEIYNASTFCVPADNQLHIYTDDIYVTDSARMDEEWDVWMLSSHTHKYGLDFDIFKRNADGTRGEQLYEGFYNTGYTFNQGFYDFAHPPIRKFSPPLRIKASEGLIYEAQFKNNGTATACFGPTTDNEMLVAYYQYTVAGKETSVPQSGKQIPFTVFPNPFSSPATLQFEVDNHAMVSLEIFNALGVMVKQVVAEELPAGKHVYSIHELPAGVYHVRLTADGAASNKSIVSCQ
ncbi:MAG TPA: T9SS type A sorting domain-containing protein, partial [Chitinophagales bacterium]|nr:T9SS type A sorting domain-containing protein [Chitinophagales bacterium]